MPQPQRRNQKCHRCGASADKRAEWVGGWGGLKPLVLHFCATCYLEAINGPGEVGADGGEWPEVVLHIYRSGASGAV